MNAVEVLEEMQVFVENLPFELKQILQEIQVLNAEIEKIEKLQRQNDIQVKRKIKSLKIGEITGAGLSVTKTPLPAVPEIVLNDATPLKPATEASNSAGSIDLPAAGASDLKDSQNETLSILKKDSEELLKTEPALMALYQAIELGFDQIQEKTALKIELAEKGRILMERHYSRITQELERIEEMELSGVFS